MEKFISFMIWMIATLLGKTWRFEFISSPSSDVNIFDKNAAPKIYCFWHSTLLVVAFLFRNTNKAAIVSRSKDGRIAAHAAKLWKHEIIFGSSKRGGMAALRQSVRAIENGRSIGITPDGPKGPANVVKAGAAQIAITAKTPLVAISVATKSAWRLRSWDKFLIPHPFAKITVTLSDAVDPHGRTTDELSAIMQEKLS